MLTNDQIISDIAEHGKRLQGRKEYVKFLSGERIVASEAIKAMCYDCQGYYEDIDGDAKDCGQKQCPLYPFNPYNPDRQKSKRAGNPEALARHRGK